MTEFFAFVSLILTVIGIITLINVINRWADKSSTGVDKLPDVMPDQYSPDRTIFVLLGGEQKGPYPRMEVIEMVTSNTLPETALCWQVGEADWRPVAELIARGGGGPGDAPGVPPTGPTPPTPS